jgi:hypothetical protein
MTEQLPYIVAPYQVHPPSTPWIDDGLAGSAVRCDKPIAHRLRRSTITPLPGYG